MALAKYAEEIQEAFYERMAMREREYNYRFRIGSSKNEGNQSKQEKDKCDTNTFVATNCFDRQN